MWTTQSYFTVNQKNVFRGNKERKNILIKLMFSSLHSECKNVVE